MDNRALVHALREHQESADIYRRQMAGKMIGDIALYFGVADTPETVVRALADFARRHSWWRRLCRRIGLRGA